MEAVRRIIPRAIAAKDKRSAELMFEDLKGKGYGKSEGCAGACDRKFLR